MAWTTRREHFASALCILSAFCARSLHDLHESPQSPQSPLISEISAFCPLAAVLRS